MGALVTHKPDCAMSLYAHLDPATLKQPLVCDSDCDGSEDEGEASPFDDGFAPVGDSPIPIRPARSSTDVVLTGDTARAYKALQTAETQLKAAQKHKDEALRAFLEAAVR